MYHSTNPVHALHWFKVMTRCSEIAGPLTAFGLGISDIRAKTPSNDMRYFMVNYAARVLKKVELEGQTARNANVTCLGGKLARILEKVFEGVNYDWETNVWKHIGSQL